MKIENNLPTKNYNVSTESDSSLFFRYVGFFVCILLMLYLFFISLGYIITAFVSIEDESKLFGGAGEAFELSALPESLAKRYQDLPYEISVADMEGTENAFADLGGKIYISQELLEGIEYIEELDFLIGHEGAHIENRDVLKSLVSDVPMVIILSLFGGDYGSQIFTGLLGNNYSKLTESKADRYGLDFTNHLNGHIGCALDFFKEKNTLGDNILEVFSTHPMTKFRIQRAEKYIESQGYEISECTPISL